jgi:hypothetical protein
MTLSDPDAPLRPVRLRLSRKKGFDLQKLSRATNGLEAVKADRASGFGNPFPIVRVTSTSCGVTRPVWEVGTWEGPAMWFRDSEVEARDLAVMAFKAWIDRPAQSDFRDRARAALRGKNLACWCGEGPCHADVLLELANSDAPLRGKCLCHRCQMERGYKFPGTSIPMRIPLWDACRCGNKRCPKASDHRLECSGSNEPGQPGSIYK